MPKPKETKPILGSQIESAHTINSMYADGKIELTIGKEYMRIDVSEITKLLQKQNFIAAKKSKYYHLTIA